MLMTSTLILYSNRSSFNQIFSYLVSIWLSSIYRHCYARLHDSWLGFNKCTIGSPISRSLRPYQQFRSQPHL